MGDVRTEHFTYLTKEQWSDTQDKVNFMEVQNCEKALLVIDMQNVCVGEKKNKYFKKLHEAGAEFVQNNFC